MAMAMLVLAMLIAAAVAEQIAPAFAARHSDGRLRTNVVLGCLSLTVAALLPLAVAGLAIAMPFAGPLARLGEPWRFGVSLVMISLAQYALHRASHRFAPLWRVHRVHHSDTAIDLSTTFRHHPLEMAVALGWYGLVAGLSGASPAAVVAYGWAAQLLGIAHHADVALPTWAERWLSRVVITPGLHHVHHSADQRQTDSNYGDVVPWWDRLFGTLSRGRPERIGLGEGYDAAASDALRQLALPFSGDQATCASLTSSGSRST